MIQKKSQTTKKAVAIVTAVDFPTGMAATFRVTMFAKAFQHAGYNVFCLLQYLPGVVDQSYNRRVSGISDGIQFRYCSGSTIPPSTLPRMLYYKSVGLLRVCHSLLNLSRGKDVSHIFSYGNTGFEDFFYLLMARLIGASFIMEICDEYIIYERSAKEGGLVKRLFGRMKRLMGEFREKTLSKKSDYLFVVSEYLFNKYADNITNEKLLLTPIIGDHKRYENVEVQTKNRNIKDIVWSGNFREWEGLENLVEAIRILKNRKIATPFRCYLYGATDKHKDYLSYIHGQIRDLHLQDIVKVMNFVPQDVLIGILKNADILVISRRNTKENWANFPTKLVDYLMTGRPVLATPVGEVKRVFSNRNEVLLTKDDSPEAIADGIEVLLGDGSLSKQMGERGKDFAIDTYDFRALGKRISATLK